VGHTSSTIPFKFRGIWLACKPWARGFDSIHLRRWLSHSNQYWLDLEVFEYNIKFVRKLDRILINKGSQLLWCSQGVRLIGACWGGASICYRLQNLKHFRIQSQFGWICPSTTLKWKHDENLELVGHHWRTILLSV
jgi:hypothetical protein